MTTCEFCMYAGDECFLLREPIEYDSSGMTVKENCPMKIRDRYIKDICDRIEDKKDGKVQISYSGRQDVRSDDKQN